MAAIELDDEDKNDSTFMHIAICVVLIGTFALVYFIKHMGHQILKDDESDNFDDGYTKFINNELSS